MGVSRRDFVAMLLGAPLAYACRARGPLPVPEGALVETGMRRGHAVVRDARAVPAPTTWRHAKVAIVGGGVAGLAAAWELRRRGMADAIVLELDDVIGGTARGGESSVTAFPWGAHYIVAPMHADDELTALLAQMGAIERYAADGTPIVDEALRCREPEERVWFEGRWWEGLYLEAGASADDRRQLAAFRAEIDRWAAWRDAQGRRAFAIPRRLASDAPEVTALDRTSFATWLDAHGLTSPRLRWLTEYACRDDYALTAARTSAWAGIFYFAARQKGPGAPSQPVVTWPDGNASLVRELARGANVERGLAVADLDEETGRLIAVGDSGPIGFECDAIICCVPRFVANRIIRGRRGQGHGDYGAWTVANVHLRARPIERGHGAPPAWDNVFRDSPSLGYVCATHQRGRDRGPTVWTWYYPFCDEDSAAVRGKLAGAGHAEWAEVVLADLERAHPDVRRHVERIDVAFWGHGMIRPRVGAMFGADPTAPLGRVHFAHTDLSGLALFEEAFDHGLRAAREVAGRLA
ncbi:MAG TPA: FAD-dependent oxidoreductase [Kofleriaceae bacterium]